MKKKIWHWPAVGPIRRGLLGAAVGAGLAAAGQPAMAAGLWGLVIGVDDYQYVNKLDGAVNDARDIAQALRRAGADDVRLLTDGAADRDHVLAAWKDIVGKAKPGDTVVLSFAGHGAEARDAGGVSHQFVVLPGFAFKGEGTYQRIFDAEFGQMLRAVPQLNVVFVVDSCHAGTMTRDYSKRRFKVRAISVPGLEDDRLAAKMRDLPPEGPRDVVLPNVVHLGAVQPAELDPEVMIDGKPRGALSFAVSRALEGYADSDHDGALQGTEIEAFVRGIIGAATDGQQHPTIATRTDWSLPLRREAATASPAATGFAPQPIALAIVNPGSQGAEALAGRIRGVRLAADDRAALTWDVARGTVSTRLGDIVSFPGGNADVSRAYQRAGAAPAAGGNDAADLPRVQRVVDKMILVEAIKAEAARHSLSVALSPDDKIHHDGAPLSFIVQGHAATYLTLFNLASDGTVNFLYPLAGGGAGDPLQIPANQPYRLDLKASPPFGADHLVAIVSSEALPGLHKQLAALDQHPAADRLAGILAKELSGKTYQIGIHPSFTAPK